MFSFADYETTFVTTLSVDGHFEMKDYVPGVVRTYQTVELYNWFSIHTSGHELTFNFDNDTIIIGDQVNNMVVVNDIPTAPLVGSWEGEYRSVCTRKLLDSVNMLAVIEAPIRVDEKTWSSENVHGEMVSIDTPMSSTRATFPSKAMKVCINTVRLLSKECNMFCNDNVMVFNQDAENGIILESAIGALL